MTGGRLNARGTLNQLKLSVAGSSPRQDSAVATPPTDFMITFTHSYDPQTIDPADLHVNGRGADTVTLVDSETVLFHFNGSPVVAEGPQVMSIRAGSILRAQDGDWIGDWEGVFYYDTVPLMVVSATPSDGQTVPSPPVQIVIDFNEPILGASVGPDDLIISSGTVVSAEVLGTESAVYTVADLIREGAVTYKLKAGAVLDAHGTPGPAYVGHFVIDDPLIERFTSTDVPQSIRDLHTITSTVEIFSSFTVADVDVELSISHTWDSDLDVFLIAPDGTRIELFTDVGGGGKNFTNTTLDDDAAVSIANGTAPFTGRFRPEGRLADLNGFNAQGTWTLEITDDYARDQGTLHSWALLVEQDVEISPRISSIQPLPTDGLSTWAAIHTLAIRFSEVMDPDTVNDLNNWSLVAAGPDQLFDTADDVPYTLALAAPYDGGLTVHLAVVAGQLPVGRYRFTAMSGGLADLLGNPLDGDGDSMGGDHLVRCFEVLPKAPFPFLEDFEAGSLTEVGRHWEWSAGANGRVAISSSHAPHGGNYHLLLDETAAYAGVQSATLHVDLAGQSNVVLDFWQRQFGSVYESRDDRVQISADGQSWYELVALTGTNSQHVYQHHVIDLDAAVAAAGWSYTEDFQIRFSQDNYYLDDGGFAFDDVRLSRLDLQGPQVLAHTPATVAATDGPLDTITLLFNEEILSSSFEADGRDVALLDPQGRPIAVEVVPVAGSGGMQFTLTFAEQTMRGSYRLKVGPHITDLAGNALNQDGNSLNGQATDAYHATIYLEPTSWSPPAPPPELYRETFDAWSTAPPYWALESVAGGMILPVSSGAPYSAGQHLLFHTDAGTQQSAIVVLDLADYAAAADLNLEFWAKCAVGSCALSVDLSGDGTDGSWQTALSVNVPAAYGNYFLDLHAQAALLGIALDADVYIRFRHGAEGFADSQLYLDDVRVVADDTTGPRVLSHRPVSVPAGDGVLSTITVTFDEEIWLSSFESDGRDVTLLDPQGRPIAVEVVPVGGSGGREFMLTFAEQTTRGYYRLVVGPDILDTWGNPLNQDADALNGQATDVYVADIYLAPTSWSPPAAPPELYHEPFDAWSMVPPYWALATAGSGTVLPASDGSQQLRMDTDPGTQQSATLVLDLTDYTAATDLNLTFWAVCPDGGSTLSVDLSDDGTDGSWRTVLLASVLDTYGNYTLDFDAQAALVGVALDADVYVRFRHIADGVADSQLYLDDVRVLVGDVAGARVVSHTPVLVSATDGPLSVITLTFDEEILQSSFEADGRDVMLWDPLGRRIAVEVVPVAGSGGREFMLTFAEQTTRGSYRLVVGPEILDASGNRLNQDGDALNGQATDVYAAEIYLAPRSWTPAGAPPELYHETFAEWSAAPAYWALESAAGGTLASVGGGSGQAGGQRLLLDTARGTQQSATVVVDLGDSAVARELTLTFWAACVGGGTLSVDLNDGGVDGTWRTVWSLAVPDTYGNYVLGLGVLAAGQGVALDGDVLIRFRHGAGGAADSQLYLGDVRILAGDVRGATVVSHVPAVVPAPDGALSVIRLTFNEEMLLSSFEHDGRDVMLWDPQGRRIEVEVVPVSGSGGREFMLTFAEQTTRGYYRLLVGPDILDVSGNPLNQDADALNGQATDVYAAAIYLEPTSWSPPAAPPELYHESFDAWSTVPPYWALTTAGSGTVLPASDGDQGLRMDTDRGTQQWATVVVDLADYAATTDLNLTFWAACPDGGGTLSVDLSDDGTDGSWRTALSVSVSDTSSGYFLDLGAQSAQVGVALDTDVYVRFRHSADGVADSQLCLDDVRVLIGDVAGARVVSHTPVLVSATAGPLSVITLTFDEEILQSSFEADGRDVLLWDPQGHPVAVEVVPVTGSGGTQFALTFAEQTTRGYYRLVVGPEILDVSGNWLNQDGDALNGQATDAYHATIYVEPISWASAGDPPELYHETFAEWSVVPAYWALESASGGSIDPLPRSVADGGGWHLRLDTDPGTQQSATVVVDLGDSVAPANLTLAFWTTCVGGGTLSVDLSDSGVEDTWRTLWSVAVPDTYGNYALDLGVLTAGQDIALDGEVQIRFRHGADGAPGSQLYLGDVRILSGDVRGAAVVSHVPAVVSASDGALSVIRLTFNEEMLLSSFEPDGRDVTLLDPQGRPIAVEVVPVDGSGGREFMLTFAEQTTRGYYRLVVGPDILDVSGNPLNQDGDTLNGQATDVFAAAIYLEPTSWSPPAAPPELYHESFDAWSTAPPYWALATAGSGTIVPASDGGQGLRMDTDRGTQQWAAVVVDLAYYAAATDLNLTFWAACPDGGGTLSVDLSDDGTDGSWRTALSISAREEYNNYSLDLDEQSALLGITLDADVYVRFRHSVDGVADSQLYLDDVRVLIGDVAGARVVSHTPVLASATEGPLSVITLTFDEEILQSSFEADGRDVLLWDPQGHPVAVEVVPVAGSGGTQFALTFAEQTTRGYYRLVVGPEILDVSGNWLNQDGDALNGRAADGYTAAIYLEPTSWAPAGDPPELYHETFEEWSVVPAHWALESAGGGSIDPLPRSVADGGGWHLRLDTDPGTQQSATVVVDLGDSAGSRNLILTFWTTCVGGGTLSVDLSDSGVEDTWRTVWSVAVPDPYDNYALDLGVLTAGQDSALDGEVQIRFRHGVDDAPGSQLYLGDVRILSGDVRGAAVVSHVPAVVSASDGALSVIRLTFDEEMLLSSFESDGRDVTLLDPRGRPIAVEVVPVGGSGGREFVLTFAEQTTRGYYRLVVGPDILDVSGNPLNQDGDAWGGQLTDAYQGRIYVAPASWSPSSGSLELYHEPFEDWSTVPPYWALESTGSGTIWPVTSGAPHGSGGHLLLDTDPGTQQSTTLVVDLADYGAATDLTLTFWAACPDGGGTLSVDLSDDGTDGSWRTVASITARDEYNNYSLDLDEQSALLGIALDADVYVRFRHSADGVADSQLYLDDVRVLIGDVAGARVVSHTPVLVPATEGPLSVITLTFDEEILQSSFESDGRDVTLLDPQGRPIPVEVVPVAGSGGTQFALTFAEQTTRGYYRLVVGPEILDASGNPLNQDGDALNGQVTDVYAAAIYLEPTSWSPPAAPPMLYRETFDQWSMAPAYWALESVAGGMILPVSTGAPHSGSQHLLLHTDAGTQQSAIVVLDLADYGAATDLYLAFWASCPDGTGTLSVDLSGDGADGSWQTALSVAVPTTYGDYFLDLDAQAALLGIALDADVYIRFRREADGLSGSQLYLDDVRVVVNDADPPRADVLHVAPDPRTTHVDTITIVFSEPIVGFELSDLTLTRNGGDNLLTASQTLTSNDDVTWHLSNLTPLTRTAGTYVLTLLAAGSGIVDLLDNPLVDNASDVWVTHSTIAGRHIFYNNSRWDAHAGFPNGDPAANVFDDAAIAPDKQALVAGQHATFANYTSYSRGINGIMVDIANVADPSGLSVVDFEFRTGNHNNPAGWSPLALDPALITIDVRPGAGTDGSDRVTIVFPDSAVRKTWLQVTVKATDATGLATPDVHFWGNAVGDSGNSPKDTAVNVLDALGVRANLHTLLKPAAIDNRYDYNRDKQVNVQDELIVRANLTTLLSDLNLIDLTGYPRVGEGAEEGEGDAQGWANDELLVLASCGDAMTGQQGASLARQPQDVDLAWSSPTVDGPIRTPPLGLTVMGTIGETPFQKHLDFAPAGSPAIRQPAVTDSSMQPRHPGQPDLGMAKPAEPHVVAVRNRVAVRQARDRLPGDSLDAFDRALEELLDELESL